MARKILAVCLLVALAACGKIAPVYDVVHEPVVTGSGNAPTLEQVRVAIRQAAIEKTWRPQDNGDNQIIAHFNKGTKVARVKIDFTTKEYSITYVSSERLKYDGTNIHARYNSWILGLRKVINGNLLKY